jgi:hypothetical protein
MICQGEWSRRCLRWEPLRRTQGSDFLDTNAALAEEVRRTFADLDRIDGELKKASKAITSASGFLTKYKDRLHSLCESAAAQKIVPSHHSNESVLHPKRATSPCEVSLVAKEENATLADVLKNVSALLTFAEYNNCL